MLDVLPTWQAHVAQLLVKKRVSMTASPTGLNEHVRERALLGGGCEKGSRSSQSIQIRQERRCDLGVEDFAAFAYDAVGGIARDVVASQLKRTIVLY